MQEAKARFGDAFADAEAGIVSMLMMVMMLMMRLMMMMLMVMMSMTCSSFIYKISIYIREIFKNENK